MSDIYIDVSFSAAKLQAQNLIKNRTIFKDKEILIVCIGGTIIMEKTDNELIYRKNYLKEYFFNHPGICDKNKTFTHSKHLFKDIDSIDISEDFFLYTPTNIFNRRIKFKLLDIDEPIEGNNVGINDWKYIGNLIKENYAKYDGFIILHGLDTMTYSASVLSFMFENLDKTVVMTSSCIPIGEMRNDALVNIIDAITVAGTFHIPEVTIMCNSKLYRGNRSIRVDNVNLNCYTTPNLPCLIDIGIFINVNWELILPPPTDSFNYFNVRIS